MQRLIAITIDDEQAPAIIRELRQSVTANMFSEDTDEFLIQLIKALKSKIEMTDAVTIVYPPAECGKPKYVAWACALNRPHDTKAFYLFSQSHTGDRLWHDGREYIVTNTRVA